MSFCLNPDCNSQNPPQTKFCQRCGSKLLLRGRYRAIKFIGEGGFGRTYQAVDEPKLNTPCVIKQFLPLQQGSGALQKATELFKQEASMLKKLGKHPQIPNLLAFFEQERKLYLVQEFIDGQDLLKELQQRGKFSEAEVKQILINLLPVFQFIHERQVIHRDVKPENIIRHRNGSLVLIGFGVSKQLSSSVLTPIGTMTGTMGYAAPEQMRGMVSNSSDLYSLAVTCIRLLTGCLPILKPNGSLGDELFDINIMQWNWKKRVSISRDFEKVIDKMLQDFPNQCYQTAKEVLQALNSQQPQPKVILTPQIPISQPVKPSSPPVSTVPPQQVNLVRTKGVDYRNLEKLLAAGKWKEADKETANKMLEVMGRQKEGRLKTEDIENFPCEDLRTIDQLWVKYSNGRFGFSVQKRIYQSLGGTRTYDEKIWEAFGDTVGWRKNTKWLEDDELLFSKTAKTGHLPARARRGQTSRIFDDLKMRIWAESYDEDMGFYDWDWRGAYERSIGWEAEGWWCTFLSRVVL